MCFCIAGLKESFRPSAGCTGPAQEQTRRSWVSIENILMSIELNLGAFSFLAYPSLCMSICLQHKNMNLGHNFERWIDRNFLFGMFSQLKKPLHMTPRSVTLWPWLTFILKIAILDILLPGAFMFHITFYPFGLAPSVVDEIHGSSIERQNWKVPIDCTFRHKGSREVSRYVNEKKECRF